MSVYKIKGSWWVDIGHLGTRVRKRSPENNRTGALAYETLLRSKIARGEPLEKPKLPTFAEFAMERWFNTYVLTNNKATEARNKQSSLRCHLIPFFGKMPIDEITTWHVEEYKAVKLKKKFNEKTINNHLTILSTCLKTAIDWGLMEHLVKIKRLKVRPTQMDFLTPKEIEQLLNGFKDLFWYTMALTAIQTGMRMGELKGLAWEDIDFERRVITIQRSIVLGYVSSPKSNKIRMIPLSQCLYETLVHFKIQSSAKTGLVFSRCEGNALHHKSMRDALHRACKKVGLRPIGWHTLRHTFASNLVSKGASIKAVQELMGHSDIQTTMRYTHLYPMELHKAIALIGTMGNQNLRQHSDNQGFQHQKQEYPLLHEKLNLPYIQKQKQGLEPRFH